MNLPVPAFAGVHVPRFFGFVVVVVVLRGAVRPAMEPIVVIVVIIDIMVVVIIVARPSLAFVARFIHIVVHDRSIHPSESESSLAPRVGYTYA
jgi:hypothetical protein